MSTKVLLVGLGTMGSAYGAVLRSLGVQTVAVGRSSSGVDAFARNTGIEAHGGGLTRWLASGETPPPIALVCVSVEETPAAVRALVDAGVRRLLVEKPGAVTPGELQALADYVESHSAEVVVAYNRRFYASVAEAIRRIEVEGGIDSFHFEFTEREKDANLPKFSDGVKHHWGLANSSHVIDLAFFLGGAPAEIATHRAGELPWHPSAARFAGSGRSERGALFSYCANWTSGGRWSVELMTRESRLILRPLEQLVIQRRGAFELETVSLDNELDIKFKPGMFRQAEAFIAGELSRFISLREQAQRSAGYLARITGEGLAK